MIKIDRKSIKKNPTAGRTEYQAQGPTEISFKCEGELPDKLLKYAIITEWTDIRENSSDGTQRVARSRTTSSCGGLIPDPDDLKHFKVPGITVHIKNNQQTIHSAFPEPAYLFNYENPTLVCDNCSMLVPVDEIDVDYRFNGEDEIRVETCPFCDHENTFEEREYETIDDILKAAK